MILTLARSRTYALLTMALVCLITYWSAQDDPQKMRSDTDFPAFFGAAKILNDSGGHDLYDRSAQERQYRQLVPAASPSQIRFFVYSPFFALMLRPLGAFSYKTAFVLWGIVSLCLFAAGFCLCWSTTTLPKAHMADSFLLALAFVPFYAFTVLSGQTTAFALFVLALAIFLDKRGRKLLSGVALALLLYKPPLLVLLLPMLVITKRWTTLAGFIVSAACLGATSLFMVGTGGMVKYAQMIESFSDLKVNGTRKTLMEIDLYSALLSILNGSKTIALIAFFCAALVAAFVLFRTWRRAPESAWPIAITWTLFLNFYLLIYDASLLILTVIITAADLYSRDKTISRPLRLILLFVFLSPFVVHYFEIQPLTFWLVVFGVYQVNSYSRITSRPGAYSLLPRWSRLGETCKYLRRSPLRS